MARSVDVVEERCAAVTLQQVVGAQRVRPAAQGEEVVEETTEGGDLTGVAAGISVNVGVVHNTLMFSRPQKTVVRAPFYIWPKPVWFATHKTAHRLTPKLVDFEAAPSMAKLPAIMGLAVRG